MALTINIELDDADLKHFRKLMRNAKQAATALEDEVIITSAEKLLARVSKAKAYRGRSAIPSSSTSSR